MEMESCKIIQPIFVFVCSLMVWRLVESCSRVYEDILKEETSISGQMILETLIIHKVERASLFVYLITRSFIQIN